TELLTSVYADYFKKSKLLCTIEDPFDETDEKGFGMLFESLHGKWVVGDDLTTTHPKLIERFAEQKRINAVIIKPNQIGTVSEACLAIRLAKKVGIKTIVSHRSGETDDTFVIHLAKAGVADGVKIGAPARERILKFNELVRVFG
ncbi:MAG: Enolase, partial [Candidatus Jorgensenbacteria bacterium GW2011_GWA2_45_13]